MPGCLGNLSLTCSIVPVFSVTFSLHPDNDINGTASAGIAINNERNNRISSLEVQ